jgi:hypothetical protein
MAVNEIVTVYCKLPNGLHLTIKNSEGVDCTIRVNGPNNKKQPGQLAMFGCGVTPVPKEHWEKWLETHQKMDIVRNGHIFVANKAGDIGQAREKKKHFTGLEGINPFTPSPAIEPDMDSMKSRNGRAQGLVLSRPLAGEEEM